MTFKLTRFNSRILNALFFLVSLCLLGIVKAAEICDDIIYEVLDDETRNKDFSNPYCVNQNREDCDIGYWGADWKGPNWYKIEGKAGTRIADTLVEKCHCNTDATGYIIGTHPTRVGETVERTVCFSWINDPCRLSKTIQIRNCGNYYLYYLEETIACNCRYCTQ